ncbi:MAG: DUF1934 family protein [Clostridia bacterium]|nr:DUF1934 family protein [Clostridia bacterium]
MTEEYELQECMIEISTTVDGVETRIKRKGGLKLSVGEVKLFYLDEQAEVTLLLQGETATIDRKGDYTLHLVLENGKITQGVLGIRGAEGEMQALTHKITYSVTQNSLLASLKYALLLGGEPQEMQIRISARLVK